MPTVFISYRRDDSADVCGRIYDTLVAQYGKQRVFFDVDRIPPGADFGHYISEFIREIDVMLVVIGGQWLSAHNERGRRLDDPDDYVRIEIETALRAQKTVIPVLVQSASMPSGAHLPPSIAGLAMLNAIPVRPNPDFYHDAQRLIAATDEATRQIGIAEQLHGTAVALVQECGDYLHAIGWQNLVPPQATAAGEATLVIERQEPQQRVVVTCTTNEGDLAAVQHLQEQMRQHGSERGWLIAETRLDPYTAELYQDDPTITTDTLATFLHTLVPLDGYLSWFDAEFARRTIGDQYIELAFTKPVFDATGREIGQSAYASLSSYVDQWLSDRSKNHLSLLGDFGSGKTWFCWHCAHEQLQRYRAQPAQQRLPLLIPLGHYATTTDADGLAKAFGQRFDLGPTGPVLLQLLNQHGRLLLLFDGFDEVERSDDPTQIARRFEQLARFAQPKSKVLLTCRKQFFHNHIEERALFAPAQQRALLITQQPHFDIIYLSEFDTRQIQTVLQRRLGAPWRSTWETICGIYDLPHLVQRPVMLDIVIETLPDLIGKTQVTLVDLYRAYTARWIDRIGEERSILDSATRLALMQALAWHLYTTNTSEIRYDTIPAFIAQATGTAVAERAPYEHDMRTQSFLVRNAEGDYAFAHRSFLEFFVAEKLADDIHHNEQASFESKPLSPEIIAFLRDLPFPVESCVGWLDAIRGTPHSRYLAGNVLTLLRSMGYDLRQLRLANLTILNAQLAEADLRDVNFYGAVLRSVNVTDADLRGTDFTGAHIEDLVLGVRSSGKSVDWSPAGDLIACSQGDNSITLCDTTTLQERARLIGPRDSITSLRFSADGALLACGSFDRTVTVWRVATPEQPLLVLRGHTATVYDVCFTHNGKFLFSSGSDKVVTIWNLEDGTDILSLEGHTATIYALHIDRGDHYLVTGSFDKTVGVWDLEITKRTARITGFRQLPGHDHLVNRIAISPDGQTIASASNDTTIKLWNIATGRAQTTLRGHTDIVWSVAFSPDGRYLASGSSDTTIHLWDLSTMQTAHVLQGHEAEVWNLAFNPEGTYLISSSFDNTMRLWLWRQETEARRIELALDSNQRIRCDGMRIAHVTGLSTLQRRFLLQKGATESTVAPASVGAEAKAARGVWRFLPFRRSAEQA